MKIGFDVEFGHNEIEIPIEQMTAPKINYFGMHDKFVEKVTIYNDIPYDGVNLRHFDRFVIDKCFISNEITESANGTISKVINAPNVITKDVEHYKPSAEYKQLAVDERESFYTVQINDFVVFAEVDDVVTTAQEWTNLQKKYKDNGFSVTAYTRPKYGMNVTNIQIA